MSEKKRERGANYTPEEKFRLIELITKYKHIVEDKNSGAQVLKRKKETWEIIKNDYNSKCSTGPRQVEQLKALYDNLKQKSRKSAEETNKVEGQINEVIEHEITKAIKNLKEEKVQTPKTGSNSNAKILSIVHDQVERLPNPYDSAPAHFKSTTEIINVDLDSTAETELENDSKLDTDFIEPMQDLYVASPPTSTIELQTSVSVSRQKTKPKSTEALKRMYFKRKVQNAALEKKKLMLEITYMQRENQLKMIILNKKIEKLNKQ